jgi:hypothetical protein
MASFTLPQDTATDSAHHLGDPMKSLRCAIEKAQSRLDELAPFASEEST